MKTQTSVSFVLLLTAAVLALPTRAAEKTAKPTSSKGKYLVVTPHQPEECLDVLDDLSTKDKKLLSQIEWGCTDGDHTGYLLVDADSKDAAIKKLPEKERAKAKAIKMAKFTPEQIKAIHEKMDKK